MRLIEVGTAGYRKIAEINTGSVGLSAAASKKASPQLRPASACAPQPTIAIVSGMPPARALIAGRQVARVASQPPVRMPSVNSTLNSASSATMPSSPAPPGVGEYRRPIR